MIKHQSDCPRTGICLWTPQYTGSFPGLSLAAAQRYRDGRPVLEALQGPRIGPWPWGLASTAILWPQHNKLARNESPLGGMVLVGPGCSNFHVF